MSSAVAFKVQPSLTSTEKLSVSSRPTLSSSLIVVADLASLFVVLGLSVLLRQHFKGHYEAITYWRLWPIMALFLAAYWFVGIYPGIGIDPVSEIRKATGATTLSFLILSALAFIAKDGPHYSRGVYLLAWSGMLLAVPFLRSLIRKIASRHDWWGYPVAVYAGEAGNEVARKLLRTPELGFRPVVILKDVYDERTESARLPVFNLDRGFQLPQLGIRHTIIAARDLRRSEMLRTIERHGKAFPHLLVIPDMEGISSLGVQTFDLCRLLALEIRKNLLLRTPQLAKRVMDLLVCSLVGIGALPIITILALLIVCESGGSAFFFHTRIGKGGRTFRVWKLRTMKSNAENILVSYLNAHSELAIEWKTNHKLRNDPRLTKVGRFLRMTSLDELPQLWNILRGEMSLVGPRPIVASEIEKYGSFYELYQQVTPGLTGLWQVSGRNNTTYEERVELDTYYVRNWSPWLDIYLLARTCEVVLTREGAY